MKRRDRRPVKSVVGKGKKNQPSPYMIELARTFIASDLRRLMAMHANGDASDSCYEVDGEPWYDLDHIERHFQSHAHPDAPLAPCACCGNLVPVPCRTCQNAFMAALARLEADGIIFFCDNELKVENFEKLLAVPEPRWRTA
jgi:hypothetical protein